MEAFVFDKLFDAVRNIEIAFTVLVSNVAGFEIAVGRQRVGCAERIIEVAFEDVGACNPEFACLTRGDFFLGWGHVFGGLVREKAAYRANGTVPVFPGLNVTVSVENQQ